MAKLVSVVIPALNSEATIGKCLDSIYSNIDAPPFEVIVVDGGSSDTTVSLSRKYPVKILTSDRPQGRQRNAGIAHASGDIVAFTDSDCVVSQSWLRNLTRHFDDPLIAGVGGSHLAPENESFLAQCIDVLMQSPFGSAGARNTASYTGVREIKHNPPSNAAVRKSVLDEVGGFAAEFAPGEDVVLDAKIQRRGYKLIYDPDLIVWHPRKNTLTGFSKQMYQYGKCRAFASRVCPETLPIAYFFVVAFTIGTVLTIPLYILVDFLRPVIALGWIVYLLFVFISSLVMAIRKRRLILAFMLPPLAFIEHFLLGLGFIMGLIQPFK